MSWFRGEALRSEDLDYDSFGCCPNRKLDPFKCVQCGLPFVHCAECNTVYPHLPDTSRYLDHHNATDSSRPSHRCQRCGYTFEYSFVRNRKYRVTRSEWVAAGLGALLQEADVDDRPQLPPEIETIPWRACAPWVPVKVSGVSSPQLAAEAGPTHVLHGRKAIAIGRRLDQDDFLFYLPDGPAMLAVVHLTYSRQLPEPNPEIPWTVLYKSVQEWIDQGLVRDAAELGNLETQRDAPTGNAEAVRMAGGGDMTREQPFVVPQDGFLRRTGQIWKCIAVGVVSLSAVAFALLSGSSAFADTAGFIVLTGVLVAALAIIALLLRSIVCPQCKARLFWAVFTDPRGAVALTSFLSRRDCPACGYTPAQ